MSRKENNQDRDAHKRAFMRQLLDSYFLFRSPLPRVGYVQENKTTLQVMDELLPMLAVSSEDIVGYMTEHDYSTTTEQDGTVSWAIWRQV